MNILNKEILNSILLGTIFILVVAYMLWGMIPYYMLVGILAIMIVFFYKEKEYRKLLYGTLLFLCINASLILLRSNTIISNAYALNILIGITFSYFIIKNINRFNLIILKIIYITIGIYLASLMIILISEYGNVGFVNQAFFEGIKSSVNYVSVIMLGFLAIIYMIEKQRNGVISLSLAIFCMIICLISVCRSGVLCASLLMITVAYHNFGKKKLWLFYIASLLCLIIFVASYSYNDFFELLIDMIESKNDADYSINPRYQILTSFLNNSDFYTFLVGTDLNAFPVIRYWNGNPHNSFILAVSNMGVLAFAIFVMVLKSMYAYKKNNNTLFLVIFIILLIRSWNDVVFCGLIFDFVFLTFLMHPYFSRTMVFKEKVNCNMK